MTFSNPAGNAAGAAAAYVRALLDLLGPRDPLVAMRELLPWVAERLEGVPEARLRQAETPGKWSVIEVIQHLADSDLVAGFRVRMMLTEERPPLQGYDQDRWAREFRYRDVNLDQALGQLHGLRTANLHLWCALSPSQLERVGLHSERGMESVGFLLRLMGAHDLVHRRQIDRILAALKPSAT